MSDRAEDVHIEFYSVKTSQVVWILDHDWHREPFENSLTIRPKVQLHSQ